MLLAQLPKVNYISSPKKKKTIKTSISHYVAFTNTMVNSIDIKPLLKMNFCCLESTNGKHNIKKSEDFVSLYACAILPTQT